jgi:hypothetical protein
LRIFVSAGSFTHKQYAGVGIALTGDGVCPQRPQATLAALANFFVDFFELLLRLGSSCAIILFLRFGQVVFTLDSEAGEKLLHLKVLVNDFINVRVFFHRDRL